ncbi:isoprenoid synthase domain-containing protein [Xylogone sp. PMI_703]|nr:isoprenoid synthase domain-containing protein [Xylogone sp. PMI_703]
MSSMKAFDFAAQPYQIPPSIFESRFHPLPIETIEASINSYLEKNWQFKSEKQRSSVFKVNFSKAASLFFSFTFNERLDAVNRLFYVSLLIDDILDQLSLEEMIAYRDRLVKIVHGTVAPDNAKCLEKILAENFQIMRDFDEKLTEEVVQGFCIVLRAQTDSSRPEVNHLGPFLQFRDVDVGRQLYTALARFGAGIHLTPEERETVLPLEVKIFQHLGVVNDIYSWNKEWKAYQASPSDTTLPSSSIRIFSQETGLSHASSKRMMYMLCRELEIAFRDDVVEIRQKNGDQPLRPEMEKYLKVLEYFARGNELWSQSTPRYNSV